MAMIQRWDPWGDLRRLDSTVSRFRRVNGTGVNGDSVRSWALPLDVERDGDNFVVSASIPGVAPEDIKVTIDDGVLAIRGETKDESEAEDRGYLLRERRSGSFHRSLRLPEELDTEKAESEYRNGVLRITFQRLESKKSKVLDVKVHS